MLGKLLVGIYILYCFEVGAFLIVFPWLDFWKENLLLAHWPFLQPLFLNPFFRGAVTGLGVSNIFLGAWEIGNLWRRLQQDRPKQPDPLQNQ